MVPLLPLLPAAVLWAAGNPHSGVELPRNAHAQSAPASDADATFQRDIAPFLRNHCVECHSGAKPKGDLALEGFTTARSTEARAGTWLDVRARIVQDEMPPSEKARPARADVEAVVTWIDAHFARDEPAAEPRRPALRRLNRAEYTNTIRDLLGVDFDAAAEFPSDDVGYGFDNIGDVLSLPDMLLEKYVSAAERIAARAIVVEDDAHPPTQHVEGQKLSSSKQSSTRGRQRVLFTNGETGFDARFPRDGEYVLRARVWGQQAGDEKVQMALRLGREEKLRYEVRAEQANPGVAEVRFRADAGQRRVAVAFLNDYYKPDDPDPKNRDRNLVVEWLELSGPVDPPPLSEFQRRHLDPRTRGSQRDVIAQLARRAWRRPVARDEVDRLARLARIEEGFEDGVRLALQAILVSPHFLFLVETDPSAGARAGSTDPSKSAPGGAAHPVTQHELAARLSYFLWSSLPDDALGAAADAGKLSDPPGLLAQARRMLRDGRSSALSRNFAGQWLQTRSLDLVAPDPTRFPAWDEELAAAMRAETGMFFDAVLREQRGIHELVDADFAFVNERLARHYGLPGVRGESMRRVHVERGARGGVLGLGSVLTVTSDATRTSPTKRGKWILENLLDAATPPPPPGVGVLDDAPQGATAASMREQLEQHRKDVNCSGCHARLDPLGFGLENFDAVGAWRTSESGRAIDASGELPDGRRFDGPAALKALLLQEGAFARCLARKLCVYALGRGLSRDDEVAVDAIVRALGPAPTLAQLIEGIVASDLFRMRAAARDAARGGGG